MFVSEVSQVFFDQKVNMSLLSRHLNNYNRRKIMEAKTSKVNSPKPVHGTQEWAGRNLSFQKGCEHMCLYCWARTNKGRFSKTYPNDWDKPVLRNEIIEKDYRKIDGRYMFPSTHDIVPANLEIYIKMLKKLVEAGNEVLIVSKPHFTCIKAICDNFKDYKKQIMFRFTIGSANIQTLKFWEPKAPSFAERMKALRYAYRQGFQTSISAEPMLDTNMDALIRAVKPYLTDTIWLGRINNIKLALSLNVPGNKEAFKKAEALLEKQSDEWILQLYKSYRKDRKISWKDSVKMVVGLKRPTEKGLDV